MTTDHRPSTNRPPRRGSTVGWVLVITGIAVLAVLALLPLVTSLILVALYGLGGSGSNK
jgi:hypothetical protein